MLPTKVHKKASGRRPRRLNRRFILGCCLLLFIVIFALVLKPYLFSRSDPFPNESGLLDISAELQDQKDPESKVLVLEKALKRSVERLEQAQKENAKLMDERNQAVDALEHAAAVNAFRRSFDAKETVNATDEDAVNSKEVLVGRQQTAVIQPNRLLLPILVICHARSDYLRRTLDTLIKYRPSSDQFPIIVSQDGTDEGVWKLLTEDFKDKVFPIQNKDRKAPTNLKSWEKPSYYYIAAHYYFALHTVFDLLKYRAVVIVEEDLEVAPDFFEYFSSLLPFLESSPDIYAVSAFNDNGQSEFVKNPQVLRRSNFFPGLGWMMTRRLWKELGPKWPAATGYWDDWMREPEQRQGRDTIFPEVSRTYTFGAAGASGGQFFEAHLAKIKLNEEFVPFSTMDFNFLKKENWEKYLNTTLLHSVEIDRVSSISKYQDRTLTLRYDNMNGFKHLASSLGIMSDEKVNAYHQ